MYPEPQRSLLSFSAIFGTVEHRTVVHLLDLTARLVNYLKRRLHVRFDLAVIPSGARRIPSAGLIQILTQPGCRAQLQL
jgi:hypothetical protein